MDALDKAIEQFRLDMNRLPTSEEGLAVLNVAPANDVRVSAEARTLALALAYVQRLQASRSLEFPMLDRREIRADDAQHPVRFELTGSWKDLP
jgi:hypothetical protein